MKNIAAILVVLALVGGVLYGTLGKDKETEQAQTTPAPTKASQQAAPVKTGNQPSTAAPAKPKAPSSTKAASEKKIGVREGNLAPDFTLDTLDGKTMRLSALRGKTVIVNLWATWCPPCRAEIPDMVAFYEEARKNNVEILAVNLTETESSVPNVRRFAEGMKMQFPILLDKKSKVADIYEATVIPTSFIIDEDGVIRKVVTGPMNQKTMRELIGKAK